MKHGRQRRIDSQRGSILVVALLMMALMSLLGVTLLTVAATEHGVSNNVLASEGALMAAEAGINRGLNQLCANADTSVAAVSANVSSGYNTRSGSRDQSTPQNFQFVSERNEAGYSIAVGTGYNPGGFVFDTYQLNATGTGPRFAIREVEVRAEYGPVAK